MRNLKNLDRGEGLMDGQLQSSGDYAIFGAQDGYLEMWNETGCLDAFVENRC